MFFSLYIEGRKKSGHSLIVLISPFQVRCTFFMVFVDIRSPLLADNFLFYSYILNINLLYFLAKNIYFAPTCSGQPVTILICLHWAQNPNNWFCHAE